MWSGLTFTKVPVEDGIWIPTKQTVISLCTLYDADLTGDSLTPNILFGFNGYQNKVQPLI